MKMVALTYCHSFVRSLSRRSLSKITFGGARQLVTMESSMTKADISGKMLGASGAMIVAAFLPKCR